MSGSSRIIPASLYGWGNDSSGYIPEVTHNIRHDGTIHTPEWMMRMDDILWSNVSDYTLFCEVLAMHTKAGRSSSGLLGNQLFTSGAMVHSDVIVKIPFGDYAPKLKVKMNTGATIAKTIIVRLGHIGDQRKRLVVMTHTNCKIQSWEMQLDDLVISYRFETEELKTLPRDQDGTPSGNVIASTDYTQNTSADSAAADADDSEDLNAASDGGGDSGGDS